MSQTVSESYLIEYRKGLWESIRQKEKAIWTFISFYSGALLVIAGFSDKVDLVLNGTGFGLFDKTLVLPLFVLITFWGISIVIDANYWFKRNLIIIIKIENKFPLDDVKPRNKKFNTAEFSYTGSYIIHLHFLYFVLILFCLTFLTGLVPTLSIEKISNEVNDILYSSITSLIVLFALIYLSFLERKNIKNYHETAEHSKQEISKFDLTFFFKSIVLRYNLILKTLVSSFVIIVYLYQKELSWITENAEQLNLFAIPIFIPLLLLSIIGIVNSWEKLQKNWLKSLIFYFSYGLITIAIILIVINVLSQFF